MAKTRMIRTTFWSDPFIQNLNSTDKLIYLYLLTNEHTDICGIYEVTVKTISFETGIPINSVSKSIDTLSKSNKISFVGGWLFIKNFQKHQQKNPKVQKGIEMGLSRVPKAILYSLCIDYDTLSHLNLNSNPNFNSDSDLNYRKGTTGITPRTQMEDFIKSVNDKDASYQNLLTELGTKAPQDVCAREIDKFIAYWTELNHDGTRQHWQAEKFFEVRRRLGTWFSRIEQSKNKPHGVFIS